MRESVGEQAPLAFAADERCPQLLFDIAAEARASGDSLPHLDRLRLPLRFHRRRLPVVDRVPGRAVCPLADEYPVDRRCTLQPGGRVDDVARDHPLTLGGACVERDERLAGVDGGADLKLLADRVADRDGRSHGALRVVLVRDGGAEDGHHRVADELLDRATVPLELGPELRVIRREGGADVLGVETLGACRRADEVGEEDRHDLPLLARGAGCGRERSAAHPAEAEALGVLLSAGRTNDHVSTVNRSAETVEHGLRKMAESHVALERLAPARVGVGNRLELRRRCVQVVPLQGDQRAGERHLVRR